MREFIEKTLRAAGDAVMKHFGHAAVAYTKEDASDLVTHADLQAEKIIVEAIRAAYPDHAIVSEEGLNEKKEGSLTWYVDPIDGTKNFASHIPLFGIMMACADGGTVTHGGIYLPITGELIYAEIGKGAWMGSRRLYASTAPDLPIE